LLIAGKSICTVFTENKIVVVVVVVATVDALQLDTDLSRINALCLIALLFL